MSVLDILLEKKQISKDDLKNIRKEIAGGSTLNQALISRGVKVTTITEALGEFLNIPVRSLGESPVPFNVLEYIPQESAAHYHFVPLAVVDGTLEVGVVDPDNMEARDALSFLAAKKNIPYKIFLITMDDFEKVLDMYKGITGEVSNALSELETELQIETKDDSTKPHDMSAKIADKDKEETLIVEDAPIVKIVATIVRYAVEGNASDVHIEHMRDRIRVRFRVDGILNTSLILPVGVHSAVVARIKVLSNMRLDEKRKPQDGRFSARIDSRRIDFRVSTFPASYGEKVVMRILDQAKGVRTIEQFGLTERNLKMIRAAVERPYGLILITGPTGSGKSTTLYSILNEMDRESYNVLSLEDPVEYEIEGVSQSQVRPEIGYDFSSGLRTTLRQDPDIIMVGEIRDKETAQLAVQAALTGHLVFSTLHTNTAAGIIPRLIDMGVDPYLIAPTLVLGIAQRLVGLAVPEAAEEVPVEGSMKMMIDRSFADLPAEFKKEVPFKDTVLKIKPNPQVPKGTRGRMAVYEMFSMDKDLEEAILRSATEVEISQILRKKGMINMKEDAIIKAFERKITIEEVNKL